MTIEEEYKQINERKLKDIKNVKNAYLTMFHRESWTINKLPFAKTWLEENDKEWLDKHENDNSINETFKNWQ